MKEYWSITLPVISTGHLSEATNAKLLSLGDQNPWMVLATYQEGYFIHVPPEDPVCEEPIPEDLMAIFAFARGERHEWIRLDSAGDVIDELPTYNW